MVADARCRCGNRLRFERTEAGYKTRCPVCHALVRLRTSEPRLVSTPTPDSTPGAETCPFVEMTPLVAPRPSRTGLQFWSWPVGLASAVAMILVVVVLLLVRRS